MTDPTQPTTAADLTELRRLLEGATDGPWQWLDGDGEKSDELQDGHGEMVATAFRDDVLPDVTDGRLCAALRNAAPALLDLAEARQQDGSALPEMRPWLKYMRELRDDDYLTEYGRGSLAAYENVERALAALPPSAPPALDVERLRDALLKADRAIGVVAESDAEIDHYTAMAIEVAAEYARLKEQDR